MKKININEKYMYSERMSPDQIDVFYSTLGKRMNTYFEKTDKENVAWISPDCMEDTGTTHSFSIVNAKRKYADVNARTHVVIVGKEYSYDVEKIISEVSKYFPILMGEHRRELGESNKENISSDGYRDILDVGSGEGC